jgi:hypothetical protein
VTNGREDNSAWHMLPREAQEAWRQYAKRAGLQGRTSDAFAAGVWWAFGHALKEVKALIDQSKATQGKEAQ